MANLDYSPVPQVTARDVAPDDTMRINASPNAFGANLAEAGQQFGQDIGQLGKFYGQVAADNATNNTLQQVSNILHGDPSKPQVGPDGQPVMGPDGKPIADTGYLGMRGANAMSAREATGKAIDDAIAQNRQSLKTPEAQLQYDNETRRWRAQWTSQVGSHADEQQRVWTNDTNNTSALLALNDLAKNPTDPANFTQARERVRNALVKNAQLNGEDPQGALLKADQESVLAGVRSLIVKDPVAAKKMWDDNSGVMGSLSNYDQIDRSVREGYNNAIMGSLIKDGITSATGAAAGLVGTGGTAGGAPRDWSTIPAEQARAIIARGESRGNYEAQFGDGQGPGGSNKYGLAPKNLTGMTIGQVVAEQTTIHNATKGKPGLPLGTSAVGAYQFEQKTLIDQAKAVFGDNWQNQQFSAANQDKLFDHLYNQYHNTPGGIEQQWSSMKHGHGGTAGTPAMSMTDALETQRGAAMANIQAEAEKRFPNDYRAQQVVIDGFERQYNQTVAIQHQQTNVDAHIVESALASDNPPIDEQSLINTSPAVAAAYARMHQSNPEAVIEMKRRFDANSNGKASTYGSDIKTYLDRALAPSNDPNRFTNPGQINAFVGPKEDSPLTNTGAAMLATLMQGRGTPQGEAANSQIRQFFNTAHATLSYSNAAMGVYDKAGEAQYGKYIASVLPVILNARQSGNLSAILNPASKDYIGSSLQTFMPNPTTVREAKAKAIVEAKMSHLPAYTPQGLNQALDRLDNEQQRKEALGAAIQQQRISVAGGLAIARARGYSNSPQPSQPHSGLKNPAATSDWLGSFFKP